MSVPCLLVSNVQRDPEPVAVAESAVPGEDEVTADAESEDAVV